MLYKCSSLLNMIRIMMAETEPGGVRRVTRVLGVKRRRHLLLSPKEIRCNSFFNIYIEREEICKAWR